jgi:hypothetical protein
MGMNKNELQNNKEIFARLGFCESTKPASKAT